MWQYGINVFGALLVLAGLGIFGLQIFAYLKSGEWAKLPLKMLVVFGPADFESWINHPTNWLGLHKIVNGMLELAPLSLCALALGIWMAGYETKNDS